MAFDSCWWHNLKISPATPLSCLERFAGVPPYLHIVQALVLVSQNGAVGIRRMRGELKSEILVRACT